jgi:uncharacterized protein with GYD domain
MDEKRLIIIGVVVVIVAIIAGVLLNLPSNDPGNSILDIIGDETVPENGTIDIKLTNGQGTALKDKTVHVSVLDKKGKEVFKKNATTYANGVANVKLAGVAAGKYDVNVTFDGDNNFTATSVSKEITIKGAVKEDTPQDNNTNASDTTTENANQDTSDYQPTYSSQSYSSSQSDSSSQSSSDSSSSSDDDGGSSSNVVDENGKEVETIIDENGKEVKEG